MLLEICKYEMHKLRRAWSLSLFKLSSGNDCSIVDSRVYSLVTKMIIAWFVLVYLLTGVLVLLCYTLTFKPEPKNSQLGLIALFWPLILVTDVVLALCSQLGSITIKLSSRFVSVTPKKG